MTKPTLAQQEAIDYDGGHLLIVACAGSGKTDTLARRVARLIKNRIPRDSIIAFTFTDHAANELKARIRLYLEQDLPAEPSLGDMYIGTIHSFCLRILRDLDPKYRNWEVMDEVRQAALISANFTRFEDSNRGIGLDRLRPLTKTKTYWEVVRRFTATLNVMHQKAIRPLRIQNANVRNAIERYETLAFNSPNYFFDFNRIVDELLDRLRGSASDLASLQSRFKHLIVDEYQDIDDRQEELINVLTGAGRKLSITAVGDDDQALYGFRGASVKNILKFTSRYPNVRTISLEDNFRSTHAIVEIADSAIRRIVNRLPKEMVAKFRDATGNLTERLADRGDIQLGVFESEDLEADWVASRIQEIRGTVFEEKDGTQRPLDYADMAVLLRSVRASGALFAQRLRTKGIPVVISGTRGLFDNDEIRVVQAAFCLLARSDFALHDEDSRNRILNTAETREFIRETIQTLRDVDKMRTASPGKFLSWISAKLEELDRRSLRRELRGRLAKRIYPQDIFQEMLQYLGSQETDWQQDILFNLGAFSNLLTQFESVHQWITPANLKGLCLFLGNWAATNAEEGGLDEVARLNSVQIMTVHAAKGLEWPVVFIPRVSSMSFPSSRRNQGPDTFLPSTLFDGREYAGGDDGERRLWYVALTRCEKFLNITSIERQRKKPTEYFREIHHDCVSRGTDPTPRIKGQPRPPDDAVMLPTTFSDLTYFWRCSFEYQLRSLMNFSPGVGEQYGYGKQLHNILAEIHERARNGDVITPEEVTKLVERRFHLRYTQKGPLDALRTAAADALKRYVRENWDSLSQIYAIEKPFEFIDQHSKALITGVVDLLEKIDQSHPDSQREIVGLVDFKAHRIRSKEAFDALQRDAERQLRLYASAVRYSFPYEPATASVQIVAPKPPIPELAAAGITDRISVDVSEPRRDEALADVRQAVEAIRQNIVTKEFKRNGPTTQHCPKCDFHTFCGGYLEWRKLDKTSPSPGPPEEEREAEVNIVMEEQRAGSQT